MMRPLYPDGFVHARRSRGLFFMGIMVFALLLVTTGLLGGCRRDPGGQLPEVSGEKIAAKRDVVKGFALTSAYPDQDGDELAIALEFSRPLVGTQEFDALISVTDKEGAPIKGSWVLDDDGDDEGKVLRFPHVEASHDYVVTVRAGLTAADGARLGKEERRTV